MAKIADEYLIELRNRADLAAEVTVTGEHMRNLLDDLLEARGYVAVPNPQFVEKE